MPEGTPISNINDYRSIIANGGSGYLTNNLDIWNEVYNYNNTNDIIIDLNNFQLNAYAVTSVSKAKVILKNGSINLGAGQGYFNGCEMYNVVLYNNSGRYINIRKDAILDGVSVTNKNSWGLQLVSELDTHTIKDCDINANFGGWGSTVNLSGTNTIVGNIRTPIELNIEGNQNVTINADRMKFVNMTGDLTGVVNIINISASQGDEFGTNGGNYDGGDCFHNIASNLGSYSLNGKLFYGEMPPWVNTRTSVAYSEIYNAISDCADGDIIQLQKNITQDIVISGITWSKTPIIDLNDHTLTGRLFLEYGNLKITGNDNTLSKFSQSGQRIIYCEVGNLEISNVTIEFNSGNFTAMFFSNSYPVNSAIFNNCVLTNYNNISYNLINNNGYETYKNIIKFNGCTITNNTCNSLFDNVSSEISFANSTIILNTFNNWMLPQSNDFILNNATITSNTFNSGGLYNIDIRNSNIINNTSESNSLIIYNTNHSIISSTITGNTYGTYGNVSNSGGVLNIDRCTIDYLTCGNQSASSSANTTLNISNSNISSLSEIGPSNKKIYFGGDNNIVSSATWSTCEVSSPLSGSIVVSGNSGSKVALNPSGYSGADAFRNSSSSLFGSTTNGIVILLPRQIERENIKLLIFNDKGFTLCDNNINGKYNNLSFESRLNETGSGSVDILLSYNYNKDVVTSGSYILICNDIYPIYMGVITEINNNNINPYNKKLSKAYLSINFSDSCRKLSYLLSESEGTITDTHATILRNIVGDDYVGDCGYAPNKYTFSISAQDMLSQIDSLGEQCGAKYRSNIYVSNVPSSGWRFISGSLLSTPPLSSSIVVNVGDIILSKGNGFYLYAVCTSVDRQNQTIGYNKRTIYGSSPSGAMTVVLIKPHPIIDFKQMYFESDSSSVFIPDYDIEYTEKNALIINKKAIDVDDIDTLNKHYGSIVCTSPQMGSPNLSLSMDLTEPINENNEPRMCLYVTNSHDCKIADIYPEGSYQNMYTVILDRPMSEIGECIGDLKYPFRYGDIWQYAGFSNTGSATTITYYVNGVAHEGTRITAGIKLPAGTWDSSNYKELIGITALCTKIYAYADGYDWSSWTPARNDYIYIAGYYIRIMEATKIIPYADYFEITINPNVQSITSTKYKLAIPNGTIIYRWNDSPLDDNPYNRYKPTTLSIILQNNMEYGDVALMLSNLIRYGSNYTANVTGTCAFRNFIKLDGGLPRVGDHVALYYNDGTVTFDDPNNPRPEEYAPYYHDYELVAYTINMQTMTVNFTMGMKPLNIGDVVYRLNQNMTTNITTSGSSGTSLIKRNDYPLST